MADVNTKQDNILSKIVQFFEEAEWETITPRKQSEIDRDYYDGHQWTKEERLELADRGQPCLTINKIQPKVNFLTGHEIQSRVDPKAFPRNTPDDEEAAQAATDAIRFVVEKQDGEEKFSDAYENMLIEGFGGIEVTAERKKSGQFEIELKHWPWDRLFYDPHSRKHDFSDARYKGGVIWKDEDDAKAKWPDKIKEIEGTVASAGVQQGHDDTYEDRPRWVQSTGKGDAARNRIRVVQIYWQEGDEWWWAIYTKGGILEGGSKVIFVDDDGESVCPLIMQSVYVDRENNRYGEVRRLRDIQDEINHRRSALLHQLTVRQVRSEKGAVDNVQKARKEIARKDGWIETNPGKQFEILTNIDQTSGQAALLQESKDEMELAGPNAALSGKQGGDPSGRAILASQQGGIIELTQTLNRFRHLKLRVYRHIWMLIRQFWGEQRWVRVTDDEANVRFVGFNRPMTIADEIEERSQKIEENGGDPAQDEELVAMAQAIDQGQIDPNQFVRMENVPAEMDMDIILDEGPDIVTIQQEQFDQLVTLASSGIQDIEGEDIIKMSSLRNKDEVLKRIEARKQSGAQASPADELLLEKLAAEVQKLRSEAEKNRATGVKTLTEADEIDGRVDGQIGAFNGTGEADLNGRT